MPLFYFHFGDDDGSEVTTGSSFGVSRRLISMPITRRSTCGPKLGTKAAIRVSIASLSRTHRDKWYSNCHLWECWEATPRPNHWHASSIWPAIRPQLPAQEVVRHGSGWRGGRDQPALVGGFAFGGAR